MLNRTTEIVKQISTKFPQSITSVIAKKKNNKSFFCSTGKISPQELSKAEKYVAQTLRDRNWIDYAISSYIPKEQRSAFCALQMFNLEVMKISDNVREPSLGLGKLDFWRGTIKKIYSSEKPHAEPISICLNHACHNNPLTRGYFDRIINARAEQLQTRNIQTMKDMFLLSQNTYSTLIALTLQLLRIEVEPEHEQLITNMGRSIGICSYLRRVPYGLRNYRFLVPLDILNKHNLQPMRIWNRIHGKPAQELFDAVLEIASYAKKSFEESVRIYEKLRIEKKIHPEAFRAFLKGVETQIYLQDLQKYNFNLFEPMLNRGRPLKFPVNLYRAAKGKKFYVVGKIQQS